MSDNNFGIIMAGGIGSRFWPMSTEEYPKQFLDILGIGKSLLQMTNERLSKIVPQDQVYILTNSKYKELVMNQLPELKEEQILTEPQRKNTAPCIAYAASKLYALNPAANLIVAPSDHLILKEDEFFSTITEALVSSENGRIATIGIKPTRPDTGYGYIEFDLPSGVEKNAVLPVKQFREKPDLETAKSFLLDGNFYWNSGIFIWKASTILESLKMFKPELHDLFTRDMLKYNTPNEQSYVDDCFNRCESVSVDFAIMEHAKNIDVVLASFDWSDLGTWGSLYSHLNQDSDKNAIIGNNIKIANSKNCIVNIPDSTEAIIEGLDDFIVVQSDNRLMILRKSQEQELKNLLKKE